MIVIYINGEGTAEKLSPQHVYQGSNQTGVTVFAPVPTTTAMSIAFKLPDGTSSPYYPMTFIQSVEGLSQYEFTIPSSITQLAGHASIALRALYSDGQQTSQLIEFEIEPSVLPELPEDIDQNAYDIVMQYLQQDRSDITTLQGQIDNIEELSESAQIASAEAVKAANEAKTTADGLADSIAQANTNASQAEEVANQAKSTADGAVQDITDYKTEVDAKVKELEDKIVDGAGTAVEVAGEKQLQLSFTSDPQTQLNEKVNKSGDTMTGNLVIDNQYPTAKGSAIDIRSKRGTTLRLVSGPNYVSDVDADAPFIEVINEQNTILANIEIPIDESVGVEEEFALVSKSVQKADLDRLILDFLYPVGSSYPYVQYPGTPDPGERWTGTEWEEIPDYAGRVIVGSGTDDFGNTYQFGSKGGSPDAVVVKHSHKLRVLPNANSGSESRDGARSASLPNTNAFETWGSEAIETGVDGTGKNMMPYLVSTCWKRKA